MTVELERLERWDGLFWQAQRNGAALRTTRGTVGTGRREAVAEPPFKTEREAHDYWSKTVSSLKSHGYETTDYIFRATGLPTHFCILCSAPTERMVTVRDPMHPTMATGPRRVGEFFLCPRCELHHSVNRNDTQLVRAALDLYVLMDLRDYVQRVGVQDPSGLSRDDIYRALGLLTDPDPQREPIELPRDPFTIPD